MREALLQLVTCLETMPGEIQVSKESPFFIEVLKFDGN
jgi:hypothetical protein